MAIRYRATVKFENHGTPTNCFKYAPDIETAKKLCEIQAEELETNPGNKITRVYVLNKKEVVWERPV